MRRLAWPAGALPAAGPPVPILRFSKTRQVTRVWLLADPRQRYMHFRVGDNSVPCLAPEPCPFCDDVTFKRRVEGFAPVLQQHERTSTWIPAVAVFTLGALKILGPGPHVGAHLDVTRQQQGNTKVLRVDRRETVLPTPIPAFEIDPILLRLWFPCDGRNPPIEVPQPIEYQRPPEFTPPRPEPIQLSEEERLHVRKILRESWAGKHLPPIEEPTAIPIEAGKGGTNGHAKRNGKHSAGDGIVPLDEALGDLDRLATETTGHLTAEDLKARLPNSHPAKRPAKGGAA